MGEDAQDIIVPFLGALQASIAVLLTIFAGVLGAQFNLLSEPASKEVSKICVQLFLPALLITRIGSEVHLETVSLALKSSIHGKLKQVDNTILPNRNMGSCIWTYFNPSGLGDYTPIEDSGLGYSGHGIQQHYELTSIARSGAGNDKTPRCPR